MILRLKQNKNHKKDDFEKKIIQKNYKKRQH